MRILLYNWRDLAHPRAGGAEVYTHECARHWVEAGHQVTVFCSSVDGRPSVDERDGVRILRRGSRLGVYREARNYYKREGRGSFDVVIDQVNTRPFLCPTFVDDVPVVAFIHQVAREVWFYESPLPVAILGRHVLEPRWLRRYRDVPTLTVSESSRASLSGYGLRRVAILPEGVDVDPLFVAPAKQPTPTVVFVGRLTANKRPGDAAEAVRMAAARLPDVRLLMIGAGPLQEKLTRRSHPSLQLVGRVSDAEKRRLMASAHTLVATSVREGWGLTVSEAGAVGTPAIGYDVPGLRDSVTAAGGTLVEANPRALADELVRQLPGLCELGAVGPRPTGTRPWSEVAACFLEQISAHVVPAG